MPNFLLLSSEIFVLFRLEPHPNIITVHGTCIETPALIMELAEGSLEKVCMYECCPLQLQKYTQFFNITFVLFFRCCLRSLHQYSMMDTLLSGPFSVPGNQCFFIYIIQLITQKASLYIYMGINAFFLPLEIKPIWFFLKVFKSYIFFVQR